MASKKTTIYDIADSLNISVGTVYRALHNTGRISPVTKQKILDKAAELRFTINKSAQGIRRDPVTIGVLLCCPVAPFLDEIRAGIEYEAANLTEYNYYSDVRVLPPLNADDCPELIADHLRDFSDRQYGGVILFLSGSHDKCDASLTALAESGVPMVCLVNDLPYENRVAFVRADGYCAGRIAAEILSMSCRNQRIAILTGDSSIHIHKENLAGFMSEADKGIFRTADIFAHWDQPRLVTQRLNEIFSSSPSYQGLYITSASSVIACPDLMTLNRDKALKVVTTDLFHQMIPPLKTGVVSATIFQNPFLQGRKAVSHLYACLQQSPIDGDVKIAPQIVLQANVDHYHVKQPLPCEG